MRFTSEKAEIIGILLGDGSAYANRERGVYQLVVTGHKTNDRDYFKDFLKPLMEKNFGEDFNIFTRKKGMQ